jgi:hypothetical protein
MYFVLLMEADQIQEIHRLRGLSLSPKEIARSLKLRPVEVNEILRQQATAIELERIASGEVDPLYNCMVNELGAMLLSPKATKDSIKSKGFVQVIIARTHRQQLSVCSYLVDHWCLGVKDAFGPKSMNKVEYNSMLQSASHTFQEDFIEVTLEQAQAIVFGGVDYAARLGIEPHRDFAAAKSHLGTQPDSLLPIEFGRDGKPYYTNGPYDDAEKIIAKLNRSVGKGNYNYMIGFDG